MTNDEALYRSGFMPGWVKDLVGPLLSPFQLAPWLTGEKSQLEEWRPFREGTYEVSSHGRIRRAVAGISTYIGRLLKPCASPAGYQTVELGTKDERLRFFVHSVVAEVFLGPRPAGLVINHRDGNRQHNTTENLEYVTPSENSRHALRVLGPPRRGPAKPRSPLKGRPTGDRHWTRRTPERIARGERAGSKLTDEDVREIRRRLAAGNRQSDLAREFEISVAQMSRIARGTRWTHLKGDEK